MKVILSRKGFDSSVGGCASPILPDGRLVSLPIPTLIDTVSYADLQSPCGRSYLQLITELGGAAGIAIEVRTSTPFSSGQAEADANGAPPSVRFALRQAICVTRVLGWEICFCSTAGSVTP